MISKLRIPVLILLVVSIGACAKNPTSGKLEPDYPTIASVTKLTAQNLSFEGLKWLYQNKRDQVQPTYSDLAAVITITQSYTNGSVTVGNTVSNIVQILGQINARFSLVNNDISTIITGFISSLSVTLNNIVIAAVPDNAKLILVGFGQGVQDGLTQYTAWQSSQSPVALGVNP